MDTLLIQGSKVLIIDDDINNILLLKRLLRELDIEIFAENKPYNAINMVKQYMPDLILLDIMMPDISGFEVCRILKKDVKIQGIPIIFISAYGVTGNRVEGFRSGGVDFISRPFDRNELIARVSTHLKIRKAELQLKQNNEMMSSFIENSINGIVILNQEGKIIVWNKIVEELSGYSFQQVENQYLWDISSEFKPGESSQYRSSIRRTILTALTTKVKHNGIVSFEDQYINKTGKRIITENVAHIIQTPKGRNLVINIKDLTESRLKQAALNESEEIFRLLVSNLPDIVLVHQNGRIIYSNYKVTEFLEYTTNELHDKEMAMILSPESIEQDLELNKGKEFSNKITSLESVFLSKNGERKTGYVKAFNTMFKGIISTMVVVTDITEQKKAEQKLRESEKMYRLLSENQNDVVWLTDLYLKPIYTSPSILKFQGYTVDEFNNIPVNQSLTPQSIEDAKIAVLEAMALIQAGKTALMDQLRIMELQYIKKDGTLIWGEASATFARDDSGNIVGIQGVTRDITERKLNEQKIIELNNTLEQKVIERTQQFENTNIELKKENTTRQQAEKALLESEKKFRNLFDNSNDAIVITSVDGTMQEVNHQATMLLEYPHKEALLARAPYEIISPQFHHLLFRNDYRFLKQLRKIVEVDILTSSNKAIPVELHNKIIDYNNGKAVLTTVRDIRERRLVQQNILKAVIDSEEKQRSIFAKEIHDSLGSQLSSLNIYLNLLNLGTVDEAEFHEIISTMKSILTDTVSTARDISNNIRPSVLSNFGLIASIEEYIIKLNKAGAIHILFNHFDMNANIKPHLEDVLFRAINELITNSIRHSEASLIQIDMKDEEDKLFVSYFDNGIGFDISGIKGKAKGMGLKNIENRLSAVNAVFKMNSQKGKGFRVDIEVPLH